jgi:hypothetical protein
METATFAETLYNRKTKFHIQLQPRNPKKKELSESLESRLTKYYTNYTVHIYSLV